MQRIVSGSLKRCQIKTRLYPILRTQCGCFSKTENGSPRIFLPTCHITPNTIVAFSYTASHPRKVFTVSLYVSSMNVMEIYTLNHEICVLNFSTRLGWCCSNSVDFISEVIKTIIQLCIIPYLGRFYVINIVNHIN
jgi:hypothetical protein